jgi:hypothetical protein
VTYLRWAVALCISLCCGVAVAAVVAAEGGIGIRIIDVPASSAADPRARLYVVDHLTPGATISRRVEVSNATGELAEVAVYAAAAGIDDGVFIGAEGRTVNELSLWTAVTPETLRLSAGAVATVVVTIAVPFDAAPGEYYGVVWAESGSLPSSGSGVYVVNRVGIRMYVSVGPGGAPAPDFTITSLRASRSQEGAPVVAATVVNTGGRALDLGGSLTLTDGPGGLNAGPFDATLGVTLAIGSTEEVRIALDPQVPNGPWTATITLQSGLTERSAVAVIQFPTAGSAPPVAADEVPQRGVGTALAFVIAAVVVIAVMLAVLLIAQQRGRRLR